MADHPTINANGADPSDLGSENETQAGRDGRQWHASKPESTGASGEQPAGNEGRSSGPHLHFETRVASSPSDPVTFYAARGSTLASSRAAR